MGKTPGYRVETTALNTSTDTGNTIEAVDIRCSSSQDRLADMIAQAIREREQRGMRHYNTVVASPERFLLLFRKV